MKVTLKPKQRLKNLTFDVDFGKLDIKGRAARGNLVTKNEVHRFSLKERGASTLGGREVWFDPDVMRLNYDGRGNFLGEFAGTDRILVLLPSGEFYTTNFDVTNHYEDKILLIEKFRPKQIWTAALFDAEQGYPYLKRFTFEDSAKHQRFIGDDARSQLLKLSDHDAPMFELRFGGDDASRPPITIDAEEFIGVKSFKARGKRLTTWNLAEIIELEPKRPDTAAESEEEAPAIETADIEPELSDDQIRDEIVGQERLFTDLDNENA